MEIYIHIFICSTSSIEHLRIIYLMLLKKILFKSFFYTDKIDLEMIKTELNYYLNSN